MTLTLSRETEAALQARAAEQGMQIDAFIARVLDREAAAVQPESLSQATDMDEFFRQLQRLSSKVPSVPDPSFSRQSIYQEHD